MGSNKWGQSKIKYGYTSMPAWLGNVDPSWSSHQINALGKTSDLCTPHSEYMILGADSRERCDKYRALFGNAIDEREIELIRNATNKGMIMGNDRFRKKIEVLTGRRVQEKKRGRPIGWRKHDV